ncbi:MAG TPA: MFS transporter, partial [Rhodospirillaceae bacterium]|nr:MFS transporter [Rhodospirillaceae bacterium]
MKYLLFVLDNRRFLAFGLLLVFCSSFGQTYFISLFGNHIRTEFALSHGDF